MIGLIRSMGYSLLIPLPGAGGCAKCFRDIISFNFHNNPRRWVLFLYSFLEINSGSELDFLPKIIHLICSVAGMQTNYIVLL